MIFSIRNLEEIILNNLGKYYGPKKNYDSFKISSLPGPHIDMCGQLYMDPWIDMFKYGQNFRNIFLKPL